MSIELFTSAYVYETKANKFKYSISNSSDDIRFGVAEDLAALQKALQHVETIYVKEYATYEKLVDYLENLRVLDDPVEYLSEDPDCILTEVFE